MHRIIGLFATTLCLAACDAPETGARSVRSVVDSAGSYPMIRISGDAPQWTAKLVSVVGAERDGGSAFGSVRSVVLDARGWTYVVDDANVQVSVYDDRGRFRSHLGRRGAGPGEYRRPYSIAVLGDSIALFDPGLSRISLLGLDGRWIREWTTPPNTGPQMVRLYRNPPSTFWAYATRAGRTGLERTFVRYGSSGPRDTLPLPPPAGGDEGIRCSSPDGSFSFYPSPFGFTPLMVPAPTGERVATVGGGYRIAFLGSDGDTLRAIERDAEAAPVTDSLWEEATAEWRAYRARRPDAFCSAGGFARPATQPTLGMIFFDDVGQMWVEVLSALGLQYDVFTSEGQLRASVRGLPSTAGIEPSVTAGRIALVVADSLGEQLVHVFSVGEGPSRPDEGSR